ncbi:phosphatidate cytidylyltransferase [Sphingomonas sp.]|uniref:phosphatidate cytidylyltransferase n=1 Tax=Sphingomonas sp. TaxID=28214 RepID=UPI0025EE51C9|nr:phosphatidate cytidylyltransferase [Sphingomonas sp.]
MRDPAKPRQPSELVLRVVTGLALITVALVAVILGGIVFWALLTVIALAMMAEWADLFDTPSWPKRLALYALFVPLAIMTPGVAAGPGFLALGLIFAAFFFVGAVTRRAWLAWGVVYVGVPVLALLLIRQENTVRLGHIGLLYTIWTLALVWSTDIGAYFAGRFIGGPKLAPRVSPNKTWAGLIGGMAAATLFAFFLHGFAGLPLLLALTTPVLATLAQGGDLFESWLKRRAGKKDSGNLLPGHGGVLDRLDGLVPVAPVAALLVLLVR